MADDDGVAQVQVRREGMQVGGERVVVVPGGGLAGLAEPAPVVGDHAAPGPEQYRDLLVPGAAAERVTVNEHDGRAGAVVFVVDLDVVGVLPSDCDLSHGLCLSSSMRC